WQKVVFQITKARPYITLPREFARVINLDVRRFPIRMQNEFYELLEAGVGLRGFTECQDWCGSLEGYERGVFPTMVDLTPANQLLRVYLTDPRDIGLRMLVGPCLDQNGNAVYSQDGANSVNGFYLSFDQPFTTSNFIVTSIGGIQKDATYGDVLLYQVDATTGEQVLLSRYAPDELNPAYRRYFINRLPCACGTTGTVPILAMAKLEFIPANRDTDFLIIGNIPALIEEFKAIRWGGAGGSVCRRAGGRGRGSANGHHARRDSPESPSEPIWGAVPGVVAYGLVTASSPAFKKGKSESKVNWNAGKNAC
ncbi:MAG: hypothetical protein JWR69_4424, partial [Pedosphaera sp.]|nr:hypothetical protein [Pedosphaera sp.]